VEARRVLGVLYLPTNCHFCEDTRTSVGTNTPRVGRVRPLSTACVNMGGEGKRRERGRGGSRPGSCKGPKLVGSAIQGSNYSKAHTAAVAQAVTEWEQLQQCRNSFVSLPPVQLGSPFFGTLDCVSLVSSFAPTMSSSTFTFDDWDNVLSAPTIVGDSLLPTPSTLVLTSASSPSGEYQPFTTVGIAVSGGGGRKNVS
jgi:putative hemolysin